MSTSTEFLDEQGVQYEQVEIPLDKIDTRASQHNQARTVALLDEHVERYTHAYLRGAKLPEIIVRRLSDDSYVVECGNHRVAAARAAHLTSLPSLVIDVPDEEARRLRFIDNERNGVPTSFQERLDQALRLVADGKTVKAAAEQLALTASRVTDEKNYRESIVRAQALGLGRVAQRLTRTVLVYGRSIHDDAAFSAYLNTVNVRGLSTDDARKLVAVINHSDDYREAISQFSPTTVADEHPPATAGFSKSATAPDRQLIAHTAAICAVTEEAYLDAIAPLPDVERQKLAQQMNRALIKLQLFVETIR